MKLIKKGCDNCFYYNFEERKCRAKEACIGAGSYKSWAARYRCSNAYNESGMGCDHFVNPEGCVLNEYRWCRKYPDDLVYEDKGDSMVDKIKKMKEIFS